MKQSESFWWKLSINLHRIMSIFLPFELQGSNRLLRCWIAIWDLLLGMSSYSVDFNAWQYCVCNVHIVWCASTNYFCPSTGLKILSTRCSFLPESFRMHLFQDMFRVVSPLRFLKKSLLSIRQQKHSHIFITYGCSVRCNRYLFF